MTETEKWINESLKSLPHLCAEIRRLSEENDAFRAQQEAEENTPLTLDELRGMDGEPVWIVPNDSCPPHWRIWRANEPFDMDVFRAYRRKPEEGTI